MNEVPFIELLTELFNRLREAGLPLGIDEYHLLLRALQGGFGVRDLASLKRLCKTLWVKSAEDKCLFDYYFKQLPSELEQTGVTLYLEEYPSPHLPEPQLQPSKSKSQLPEFAIQSPESKPQLPEKFQPLAPELQPPQPLPSQPLDDFFIESMEDEMQVATAVLQTSNKDIEIPYGHLVPTGEYLSVTRRQMKQSWRYLRRPIREGPRVELDLEATVNQIGCQGIMLEPVLIPCRVNRAELLLLVDQDGSMVPFHALSRRLGKTASRGGRLGRAGIYYFHNCPIEYLYRDPYQLEAESVADILSRLRPDRSSVLIFSDAGAARGGFSPERIELTEAFLNQLRQEVRYIAWLNPMPRSRWENTTAGQIEQLVPMFEFSRRGLQDAIGVLRGHPTNLEGRKI
ncbi:MAG: hypothetical protein AB4038_15485 [Prochloraceae cyanobacterium]